MPFRLLARLLGRRQAKPALQRQVAGYYTIEGWNPAIEIPTAYRRALESVALRFGYSVEYPGAPSGSQRVLTFLPVEKPEILIAFSGRLMTVAVGGREEYQYKLTSQGAIRPLRPDGGGLLGSREV